MHSELCQSGRSVGRSTAVEQSELVMNEEEAEKAAASEAAFRSAYNQDATKEDIAYGLQESAVTTANAGVHRDSGSGNAEGVDSKLKASVRQAQDAAEELRDAISVSPALEL
ncbi:hypothetical protein HPB50_001150 [Hyalomma asiaticum]|uniref:Uncharacterized protein n=1 Tax=Hyalomma asiaticum TaxID=266040 RepID=A0ACB7TCU8_HYAAI|nr:hypothetical protein HPB50_001150 [Hyalomma asiaticum]